MVKRFVKVTLDTGKVVAWWPKIKWTWTCKITCKATGCCLEPKNRNISIYNKLGDAWLQNISKEHTEARAIVKLTVSYKCLHRVG